MENLRKRTIPGSRASSLKSSPVHGYRATSSTDGDALAQLRSPSSNKYVSSVSHSTAAPKNAPVLSPIAETMGVPFGSVRDRFSPKPPSTKGNLSTQQLSPAGSASLASSQGITRPAQKLPPLTPRIGASSKHPILSDTQRPSQSFPPESRPPQSFSPTHALHNEGPSSSGGRYMLPPLMSKVQNGETEYHYHHHRHGEYQDRINSYHLQMTAYSLLFATLIAVVNVISDISFPHCEHPVRCFDLAYEMTRSMMPSVDPCDNMYQFTCGRWSELYPVHEDQFQVLQERLFITMLKNLERPLDPTLAADKTGIAFLACMDVKSSKLELRDPVIDLLKRYDLSWPTGETRTTEEIFRLLIALSLNDGVGVFFQLRLAPYLRTDDRMVLEMTLGITMIRYLLNLEVLSDCILAYNQDIPNIEDLAASILGVENDIQASISLHTRKEEKVRYITYNDLDNIGKPILKGSWWVSAINEHLPENAAITVSSEIFMKHTHAFKLVNDILKEYERFSTDILNFIGWKIIKYYSYASSYKMSLCPWSGGPVHWSRTFAETLHFCLGYIKAVAPYALLTLQLADVTTDETIDSARHLASNMKDEMKISFNSSWLDASSSREAVRRLLALYQVIGIPGKLIPMAAMDDFYNYVPRATPDNFILWLIDAHRATVAHRKHLLVNRSDDRFRVSRDDWEPPNVLVNAYYVPVYHMIFIPGNILVPPFFALDMPDALNYGAMGWIITHEMIHAFDKDWIDIDNTGDKRVFFTKQSEALFLAKQACLVHQANKMTGSKIAGNNSLTETFADNVAMQLVFQAYQKLSRQDGRRKGFIGLTSDQSFFFSSCFIFCSMDSPSELKKNYVPNEFRCNQPVINTEQFEIVFSCGKNRPMTPPERCVFF